MARTSDTAVLWRESVLVTAGGVRGLSRRDAKLAERPTKGASKSGRKAVAERNQRPQNGESIAAAK
jgi:hypothetical protein